jgi:4-hydroxy-3-methylbut-2-en-1-yl diphosphate synthase IspG/GcpE
VEKIRINPGNYADKRASFTEVRLSQKEYEEELEGSIQDCCHLLIYVMNAEQQ